MRRKTERELTVDNSKQVTLSNERGREGQIKANCEREERKDEGKRDKEFFS